MRVLPFRAGRAFYVCDATTNDGDSSLWGIAHASTSGPSSIYGGGPGSPPPSWTSTLGDTVRQIDHKLKVRGS